MASYVAVRDAIADACRAALPNITVHATVPKAVAVPVAIVRPSQPAVMYRQAYGGSGLAMWRFELQVLLAQVVEQSAQERLAELVSPNSDLVTALNNAEVGDGWLAVAEARIGETGVYASATFTITATA